MKTSLPPMRKQPKIRIVGDTVYCTNPYSGVTFRVSLEDLDAVKACNWSFGKKGRYLTQVLMPGRKNISLHRYIMKAKPGQAVTFKDGDVLNCMRSNLAIRKPPKIKIVGDTVYCTNLNSGITFRVSREDLNIVKTWNWTIRKGDRYLTHTTNKKNFSLHQCIMKPKPGQVVDFKDGDKLNCTRSNLRVCTPLDTHKNRRGSANSITGFKGVYRTPNGTYFASICSDYKIISLGTFDNAIDAAIAYNNAALKHHKEFARLNVIPKKRGGSAKRSPGG